MSSTTTTTTATTTTYTYRHGTASTESNGMGKQPSEYLIVAIISVMSCTLIIVLCVAIAIFCWKKKTNLKTLNSSEQTDNNTFVEMNPHPISSGNFGSERQCSTPFLQNLGCVNPPIHGSLSKHQENIQNQTRNMTSDAGLQLKHNDRICDITMIDNALYESSEISQPDDLRLSGPQKNGDVQNLATDHLPDRRRSWGESAYSSVDKFIPEEYFESSEEYKPDDLRLAASHAILDHEINLASNVLQNQRKHGKSSEENAYATVDKGIPEPQFVENALYKSSEHCHLDNMRLSASHTNLDMSDHLQDHGICWGENAYSVVNKDSTKEQFVENPLYESSDGILARSDPPQKEVAYSEITF